MVIAFLLPGNGHSLELSGPSDVFEEANRQFGRRVHEVRFISEHPGPTTCLSGLKILADHTIHDPVGPIDTLIVTGNRNPTQPASPALIDWLKRVVPSTRRYGSVCTGAFLLGAAGLLDSRHVTTHWEFAPALAAAFPRAIVEPDRIFIREGPMFTSAGVAAGIDLALSLVEEDLGRAVALSVARWLVLFIKRPGGFSQFSVQLAGQNASQGPIQQVQEWVRDNVQLTLSVHSLAQRVGMGDRTFARVFRQETGMTPANFVQATRVDNARRLLEETDLSLKSVASASGFSSSQALRRAMRRKVGIASGEYRSRFRPQS
jgi:transcriptional regulator GlxA family with amidase domain